MKVNKKAVLALIVVALAVGVGGAYAATSSPHRSTPAARTDSQSADTRLAARIATAVTAALAPSATHRAADQTSSARTLTNPHGLVRAAIAKALAAHHISTTEADLADLFLNGGIKPDPTLRNAWKPVVRAGADALGISVGSLEVDLANGQSLAEIAAQQGRPPAAVAQAIEGASKTAITKAVADGALSAAAGADVLKLLQTHLPDVLRIHP